MRLWLPSGMSKPCHQIQKWYMCSNNTDETFSYCYYKLCYQLFFCLVGIQISISRFNESKLYFMCLWKAQGSLLLSYISFACGWATSPPQLPIKFEWCLQLIVVGGHGRHHTMAAHCPQILPHFVLRMNKTQFDQSFESYFPALIMILWLLRCPWWCLSCCNSYAPLSRSLLLFVKW